MGSFKRTGSKEWFVHESDIIIGKDRSDTHYDCNYVLSRLDYCNDFFSHNCRIKARNCELNSSFDAGGKRLICSQN